MKIPFPWHFEVWNMHFELLASWSRGTYRCSDGAWITRRRSRTRSASSKSMARSRIRLITRNSLTTFTTTLLLEHALVLLQVFAEHILAAQFCVSSEVVDSWSWRHSILLKYPVDLLFLAPQDIPVVTIRLPPLSIVEPLIDTVPEASSELDGVAGWK